jgi:hypothetical protein
MYIMEELQYIILHSITTLPGFTLSYIISLLFHTVHYHTFYTYHSILYTIVHYIPTRPYVQYGRVEIECKIVYSVEE